MLKRAKIGLVFLEINLLIISLFAFCFIMNLGFVSAFSESLEQGLTLGSQGGTSTGGSSWGLGKSYQTNLPTLPGEGGSPAAGLIDKAVQGATKDPSLGAKAVAGSGSWLSNLFGIKNKIGSEVGGSTVGQWTGIGGVWDTVLSGAQWAGVAYGAGYMVGSMFGLEDSTTNALSAGAVAGIGVGKA